MIFVILCLTVISTTATPTQTTVPSSTTTPVCPLENVMNATDYIPSIPVTILTTKTDGTTADDQVDYTPDKTDFLIPIDENTETVKLEIPVPAMPPVGLTTPVSPGIPTPMTFTTISISFMGDEQPTDVTIQVNEPDETDASKPVVRNVSNYCFYEKDVM